MQMGEIFHSLKKYYTIGLSTAVGDEGGFSTLLVVLKMLWIPLNYQ
jgi:enolase